jgi:prolyl oligopeptidase
MIKRFGASALYLPLFLASLACQNSGGFHYPDARRSAQVDVYHDVEVADPYRWLEDPDSEETRAWVVAQNELTQSQISGIHERSFIHERLRELYSYERFGLPQQRAGRTFFTRNDGVQNQSVLYVADASGGGERLLLDPNTFSEDGTISLAGFEPSWDGRLLAFATSNGGSDWRTWQLLEIETGRILADSITGNKFGGMHWEADSNSLLYTRYARAEGGAELRAKNETPEIYRHRLGSDESRDELVLTRPEQEGVSQGFEFANDRSSLVVSRWQASSGFNELYLYSGIGELRPLAVGLDADYSYIEDNGSTMWVQTTLDSPKGRVIAIDMAAPERDNWREVIAESEHALRGVSAVGGHLIANRMVDATSQIQVYDLEGALKHEVVLPGLGTAAGFGGQLSDTETYFSFTSFIHAPTIYRYEIAANQSSVYRAPDIKFDSDEYYTYQVFYRSLDGRTQVPMFITHRKDVEQDGQTPTYLYGYGGFNVSLTPFFSPSNLMWLEMGGVLAVPNLRGGGEYGEAWHEAGTKRHKQNVFDDFTAAAHWLIRNEYTTPRKLAIAGGSNGGLLVGACMTQNPGLYGAALPAVGVLDMLRYHLFTIGWAWAGDYATVDNRNDFYTLLAYSPLHNVSPGTEYPATLITTGDHDDRVVPAHSFKFAAALQDAQKGNERVLIRIETRAGHGAGKPLSKRLDEAADIWTFLYEEFEMTHFDVLYPTSKNSEDVRFGDERH